MPDMKFHIVLLLIFFPFILYGQNSNKVIIKGKVKSDNLQNLKIYSYGVDENLFTSRLDTIFTVTPYIPFQFEFTIDHSGMYGIQDGMWSMFTHKIFLEKRDTITLLFTPRPHYEKQLKGRHPIFTAHLMSVHAKFSGNISFFDSLAYQRPLKYGKIKHEPLTTYRKRIDSFYHLWQGILHKFKKKNLVSPTFVPYAQAELYSRYIGWLTGPALTIPREQFPNDYFKIVKSISLNNPEYLRSLKSYVNGISYYVKFIKNDYNIKNSYANLKGEFTTLLNNETGIVLDKMLALWLLKYNNKGNAYFDTAYHIFLQKSRNNNIRQLVKSKITPNQGVKNNKNALSWAEVLTKAEVYTPEGELRQIKDILSKNKPILIDCWATWCAPCRSQMPYLKKIEKEYADSVQFVSLSFDEKNKQWKDFMSANKSNLSGVQYRLYNTFSSPFVKYLKIEAIPRYVLLSKSGKEVLITKMTLPSLTDRFKKELNKSLK